MKYVALSAKPMGAAWAAAALLACLVAPAGAQAKDPGATPQCRRMSPPAEPANLLRIRDTTLMLVGPAALKDLEKVRSAAREARATALLAVDAPGEGAAAGSSAGIPVLPLATSFARASALFSYPASNTRRASLQVGGHAAQVLVRSDKSAIQLVASLAPDASGKRTEIRWYPVPVAITGGAEANLQALEHLYQLVLDTPPLARFTLARTATGSSAAELSYGAALRQVAQWRECAARELAEGAPMIKKWESVTLDAPTVGQRSELDVIARVRDSSGRPVAGAYVSFTRGAHLACTSQTNGQGAARCTLWDAHGHGPEEHDHEHAPIIAVIGGALHADRILLPTAAVFPPDPNRRKR